MDVESIIDGFKVLDLLEGSISPSFSFQELSNDLPRILEKDDSKRLKKLHNIFAKVDFSWLFPDDDCLVVIQVTKRLAHHLVDIDRKLKEEDILSASASKKIVADIDFDQSEDVFSLILSLVSRLLHLHDEDDGDGGGGGGDEQNAKPRKEDEREDEEEEKARAESSEKPQQGTKDDQETKTAEKDLNGNTSPRLSDVLPRFVRNLTLDVATLISLYLNPRPWTNDVLNASAKELEEAFLCLNRNSSMTELLIGSTETERIADAGRKRKGLENGAEAEKATTTTTAEEKEERKRRPAPESPIVDDPWLKKFLLRLTPHLTRHLRANHLKRCSFLWLLETVDAPHLVDVEDLLFPPTLVFLDSAENDDKVLGVRCLTEILQKIPASRLLAQNRHLVILKSILHQMNFRHLPLMRALHPCVLIFIERYHWATSKRKDPDAELLIGQVGAGPSLEDIEDPETPRNQLFSQLLFQLEIGTDRDHRTECLKVIGSHIRGMGIAVCRYLKRTITFLSSTLAWSKDDSNDTTRLLILDALCDVVRAAAPRIPAHVGRVVNPIVQLAIDVSSHKYANSDFTRDNVLEKCKDVLQLLADLAPTELARLLNGLPVTVFDVRVQKLIKAAEESAGRCGETKG